LGADGENQLRKDENPSSAAGRIQVPNIDPPVIKTFQLEHPLDSKMREALVRAAVKAGYQVFTTETTDGPLEIKTQGLAELGVDGPICERPGVVHLLLIDEMEITFVTAGASWLTPRLERELYQNGKLLDYLLRYGTPAEIDARNQDDRRAEDTMRRRMLQDNRPESNNEVLRALHAKVRKMKKDKFTQQEMCRRLGSDPRPPGVTWGELAWPDAFRSEEFQGAVRKWLTDACSPRKARITKRKSL
jgi:hypothetical protein